MASLNIGAQIPVRQNGNNKCPHHRGKEVMYRCKDCEELACTDCVSSIHRKHELEDLSDCIPEVKVKIQDFVHKTIENDIPNTKTKIQEVNVELSETREHFETMINDIRVRNKLVKEEMDKLTENFVKTCQDMKKDNENTLLNQSGELQATLEELNSKIQECTETLQSGNNVQIYDTGKEFKEMETLTRPELPTVQFLPRKLELPDLQPLLGKLVVKRPGYKPEETDLQSQPSDWREESTFTPYHYGCVTSMHVTQSDEVWVSDFRHKSLLLLNQTGKIQDKLKLNEHVTDFSLSPNTQEIVYITDKNCVKTVRDGKSSVMFEADKEPLSVCCTYDDHILLGHEHQLVKYTQSGNVVACTSIGGWFSSPLLTYPMRITGCPVTHNLAVVDSDLKDCGGKDKPFVAILSEKLKILHTYKGDNPGTQSPPFPFDPRDVCFADEGKLVVTDSMNRSVILISKDGKFLQTLYNFGELRPVTACVCSDNTVSISLIDGSVKVLKYK